MGDAPTVIGIIVAGVLGGVGAWWSARKLRKAGIAQEPDKLLANLRELADTWQEKYGLEHEALVTAQDALGVVKAEQFADLRLAAQCRSDLDDARSTIRDLERRHRPRGPRVGEGP